MQLVLANTESNPTGDRKRDLQRVGIPVCTASDADPSVHFVDPSGCTSCVPDLRSGAVRPL